MKKDIEIQQNVMAELKAIPSLHTAEVGVSVKNGIVTLSGIIRSYPQKTAIEKAVLKLKDVQGIAEDLVVKLNGSDTRTDTEIAEAVLYALEWHSGIDKDRIKILVEDGTVTIEGEVDWDYQRKQAHKTISNITGVKAIINNLKIAERPLPSEIKNKIHEAFQRSANVDASAIKVEIDGHKVIIRGKVKSWAEKKEAEAIIWNMPGVTEVDNRVEYEIFDPSEIL